MREWGERLSVAEEDWGKRASFTSRSGSVGTIMDPDQAKLCASFGSESPTLVHCITHYSKQNLLSIQQNLNIDM